MPDSTTSQPEPMQAASRHAPPAPVVRLSVGLALLVLVWAGLWGLSSAGKLSPPAPPPPLPAATDNASGSITPTATFTHSIAIPSVVLVSPTPTPTATPAPTRTPTPVGVGVYTTTITLPSHHFLPALTPAENAAYHMPYYRLDWDRYDPLPTTDATFTLVVLENEALRVSLLPQLGGRIYQLIDKSTDRNLLYQNPGLKPTRWGPPEMGWWLAVGGIEWCLPVEEHGYEWAIPWHYDIQPLPAGEHGAAGQQVVLWDSDARDRLQARISVGLYPGDSRLHISPTIENPTRQAIRFKFWLNAMVAPAGDNRLTADTLFLFPAQQVVVHSSGDERLPAAGEVLAWPVYENVDWSRLGAWRQWFGFFQYPRAQGGLQAVFDASTGTGLVRAYDDSIAQGAKFFGMGWGTAGLPPDLYTDDDSNYVELHGGLAATFADNYRLPAGGSITWQETWYPVSSWDDLPAALVSIPDRRVQFGSDRREKAHHAQ